MLNKEEHRRLSTYRNIVMDAKRTFDSEGLGLEAQLWLIEKVELLNELVGSLTQKNTEERRVVTQAKIRLIKELGMSEPDAYKFIQDTAMMERVSKGTIAHRLLNLERL